MRILFWIVQTLMLRSWLIVAGVAVGLAARTLVPSAEMVRSYEIADPVAKEYYDQVIAEFGRPLTSGE